MKRWLPISIIFLFLSLSQVFAAKIENARAAQADKRVQFTYDLTGTEAESDVNLIITLQGRKYRTTDLHLEGDVGRVKIGKDKVIYWHVLQDFPEGLKSSLEWEIVAGDAWELPRGSRLEEIELVLVKGGCFLMGDTYGDGDADEKPVHEVCVGDFYLGKHEVTQGQWQELMGTNPAFSKKGPNYPVENVSWNDVQAFIQRLNERTGRNFRLPTEAEWEYAAKLGNKREKFAGTSEPGLISRYGNFCDQSCDYDWKTKGQNDGFKNTSPAGALQPNGLGLYDMTGNVREWVQDWYGDKHYLESQKNNPQGPSAGTFRVLRGGSWNNKAHDVRSTARAGAKPDSRYLNNGFRLAIKPDRFDHFNLTAPEKVTAGHEAILRVEAVDSLGNVITDYQETDKVFTVSVTGLASVNPELLKPSAFANGVARISIIDKAAETVRLSIAELGSLMRSVSRDIRIVPDRLHSFYLKGPGFQQVQAGTRFEIEIIAKDMHGNTVTEPINGKGISLNVKGEAEPKLDMASIPNFINGMSFASLVSNKTGTFVVEVLDVATGSAGVSDTIEVISAALHSFKIFAAPTVSAGDPFEVTVVAVDRFDNPVTNTALAGNKIILTMGKAKTVQVSLPAYQFVYGQAKVELQYDVPEDITISVADGNKGIVGRSETITVLPVIPARFEVKTPGPAIAGEKFKIMITAYSQSANIMKNYHLVGPDVKLITTGTGTLVPNLIPATEFVNGVAVVDGFYDKSETFMITATAVVKEAVTPSEGTVEEKKPGEAGTKVAVAPIPKEAGPTPGKKAGPSSMSVDERKRAGGRSPFELTEISLEEDKDQAVLSFHIPNIDKSISYKVSTKVLNGKTWVIVRTKPLVNKLARPFETESSLVGQVLVNQDQQDKLTQLIIIIQLKPARFYVTRDKDVLKVTLKHSA